MSAVIRKARDGDEKEIARFAIELFEQHVGYDPERFSAFSTVESAESFYRSRFDTSGSVVLVAEIAGHVVGFAYVEKDERNYAELLENGAWLHDIFIDKSARSDGVGKMLIRAAANVAAEMGADKLLLTVAAKNEPARRAFVKAGFRHTMSEMTLDLMKR